MTINSDISSVLQEPEVVDEKIPLEQLLKIAGGVIYKYYPQLVIDQAKTSKSVDNYINWLGWGNDLAMKIRAGFRIKQYYPAAWKDLKQTDRKVSDMFRFGKTLYNNPKIKVSTDISIGGHWSSIDILPFFLRDIKVFPEHNSEGKTILNSIDRTGRFKIREIYQQIHLKNNLFPYYHGVKSFERTLGDGLLNIIKEEKEGRQNDGSWNYATTRLHWKLKGRPHTHLTSQVVALCLEDQLPMLCKTAELYNETNGGYETVRIVLRLDFGYGPANKERQLGFLEYQNNIEISENLSAVLRIRYPLFLRSRSITMLCITDNLNQIPMPDNEHFILGTQWTGSGMNGALLSSSKIFKEEAMGRAFTELGEIAKAMVPKTTDAMPLLEKVFGLTVTTNRPDQFSELFC